MKKYWCKHFVPFSTDDHIVRREAATWAMDKFTPVDVDIFYNGPNDEPGIWFCKERDALMFALKWMS